MRVRIGAISVRPSTVTLSGYYYAVAVGKRPGIYESWAEAQPQVTGVRGAKYKKFKTRQEAQQFIADHTPAAAVSTSTASSDLNVINVFTDGACIK